MSRVKTFKIDLETTYPCPCRKRGQLTPIVLTDAFGCDQCHQIFVVRADGYVLEQLSSIYPYQQLWYWTGKDWMLVRRPFHQRGLAWLMGALTVLFLVMLCLPIAFHIPFDRRVMVWMLLTIFIALVLSFMVWLTIYRQN